MSIHFSIILCVYRIPAAHNVIYHTVFSVWNKNVQYHIIEVDFERGAKLKTCRHYMLVLFNIPCSFAYYYKKI